MELVEAGGEVEESEEVRGGRGDGLLGSGDGEEGGVVPEESGTWMGSLMRSRRLVR
jgi:hypothetical protein